jgi:hypothetical protein
MFEQDFLISIDRTFTLIARRLIDASQAQLETLDSELFSILVR